MAKDWTIEEVEYIVKDYFDMFASELKGEKYNKSEHRRLLSKYLNNRTDGSIERKHQNISAALNSMGFPSIIGYKPLKNFQKILLKSINQYIDNQSDIINLISNHVNTPAVTPKVEDILKSIVEPPKTEKVPVTELKETIPSFRPRKTNFLAREAKNTSLGLSGEIFVLSYERARLIYLGKESLSDKIEHTSVDQGDGAGFDIHSYEKNGTDRFIEVKTTRYGKETPFFISSNEVDFSEIMQKRYYLYRVFDFTNEPRLFTLNGQIQDKCMLSPSQYVARF
jgi:hypothetical protein